MSSHDDVVHGAADEAATQAGRVRLMPRVLNVGQCALDHGSITRYLQKSFQAEVTGAATFDEALGLMETRRFDLILVNRVSDRDGSLGLELVEKIRDDPRFAGQAVMLVSNFPDAQAEAEALGALPGFGKAELLDPRTRQRLDAVLARSSDPTPRA